MDEFHLKPIFQIQKDILGSNIRRFCSLQAMKSSYLAGPFTDLDVNKSTLCVFTLTVSVVSLCV